MSCFRKRVGLRDKVAELEHKLAMLESDTIADIVKLENKSELHTNAIKRLNDLPKDTAICHICGKRDFMDNLADVGWMGGDIDLQFAKCGQDGRFWYSADMTYAHPECAKIKRSDDGKGWVKVGKK